jgi:alcohol dehydrogenase class IV
MSFEFATATKIVFGAGRLKDLAGITAEYGKRIFLLSGSGAAPLEKIMPVLKGVKDAEVEVFQVFREPTLEDVSTGLEAAKKHRSDLVIGYGGGSVIDTAKAISTLLTNPGDLLDYLEVVGKNLPLKFPAAPLIAIPTTAGTGSEVTRNAVLTVPQERFKVSLRSPYMLPKVALIDPELTLTLPPAVTASTGLDALTQVLEPFVSIKANPMTDMFCREGLKCIGRSITRVFQDGQDITARTDMAWGSLLGGLALANSGLGAVHGFAAPIGGMYDAPHGAVCARLLPIVVNVNTSAIGERMANSATLGRYNEIARILTGNENASIEDGILYLKELAAKLQIPPLSAYGIKPGDIKNIAEKAAISSSMKGNPIVLSMEELVGILQEAL